MLLDEHSSEFSFNILKKSNWHLSSKCLGLLSESIVSCSSTQASNGNVLSTEYVFELLNNVNQVNACVTTRAALFSWLL